MELGYAISSEEHAPSTSCATARAEDADSRSRSCRTHFHPWTDRQGQSPFVWSVLGGIGLATERLVVGTGVTCPTIRIHPAIVAQAAATAASMLPGRFFLGVGARARTSTSTSSASGGPPRRSGARCSRRRSR